MKPVLFVLVQFLFSFSFINAQSVGSFLYGPANGNFIQNSFVENDTTLVTIGSKINADGLYEAWLQKINPLTMQVFEERTFSAQTPSSSMFGYSVIKAKDNTYIISGKVRLGNNPWNEEVGALLKVDPTGKIIWQQNFPEFDAIFEAQELKNSFYICGYTEFAVPSNGVLGNVDQAGNLKWVKEYEDLTQSTLKHIFTTADDQLMLLGRTSVNAVGFSGVLMIKTGFDGEEVWRRRFDTQFDEDDLLLYYDWMIPLAAVQKNDGSFLIANPKDSWSQGATAILEVSSSGDLLKRHTIAPPLGEDYPFALSLLANGRMVVSGMNQTTQGTSGMAMVVDALGVVEHRNLFSKPNGDSKLLANIVKDNYLYHFGSSADTKQNPKSKGWIVKSALDLTYSQNIVKINAKLDLNNNCLADPAESPVPNLFVKTNELANGLLILDKNGQIQLNFVTDTLRLELVNPDTALYTVCNAVQYVIPSKVGGQSALQFLLQQKSFCPKSEISISKPELVRCKKAKYIVELRNSGNVQSEDLVAQLKIDPQLKVLSADHPYSLMSDQLSFDIGQLDPTAVKRISLIVEVSCDAELGKVHEVSGVLLPAECMTTKQSAVASLRHQCDQKNFKLICTNTGNQAMSPPWKCKIYQNQYLLKEEDLSLSVDQSKEYDFDAQGLCYTIVCSPPDQEFGERFSSLSVSDCGNLQNGLHSVYYQDAFRKNDFSPNVSYANGSNVVDEPNRIEEVSSKFGIYHYVSDANTLEFSARVRNETGKVQDSVQFELNFCDRFDVSSFRVLCSNKDVQLSSKDDRTMIVKMRALNLTDYQIDPLQSDAFVRFQIRPIANAKPDTYRDSSLFIVFGKASFGGSSPIELITGNYNFYRKNIAALKPGYVYPDFMSPFRSKYWEFAHHTVKTNDGKFLLTSTTNSYSRDRYLPVVSKCDKRGKVEWQKVINIGRGRAYLAKTVAASDGSIFLLCSFLPKDSTEEKIGAFDLCLAKLSASGELVWLKYYKPGLLGSGGYAADLIDVSTKHLLISGSSDNGNNNVDNYLLKIDYDGNLIWKQNYFVTGIASQGNQVHELKDGSFMIVSKEISTNSYPIYLQKVDQNGNNLWAKFYEIPIDSPSFDLISSTIESDGSLLLLGYAQWYISASQRYFLEPSFYRFDQKGNYLSDTRPILGPDYFSPAGFFKHDDHYYVYGGGFKDTLSTNDDYAIAKLDKDFNIIWEKEFGLDYYEGLSDALPLTKDTLVLWGFHQQTPSDNSIGAVLSFLDLRNLTVPVPDSILDSKVINCFPNPATNMLCFNTASENVRITGIRIYNMNGQLLTTTHFTDRNTVSIDCSNFPTGLYLYQISTNTSSSVTGKVAVMR